LLIALLAITAGNSRALNARSGLVRPVWFSENTAIDRFGFKLQRNAAKENSSDKLLLEFAGASHHNRMDECGGFGIAVRGMTGK
jgi:hypothetical protein